MPIRLYIKGTAHLVGELTEQQLSSLTQLLVQEHPDDRDYFISAATLEYLGSRDTAPGLIRRLSTLLDRGDCGPYRRLFQGTEGLDVEWRREQ